MNLFDLFESNRKDVEEARFSHPLVKSKVKFETDNPTPAAMLEYFKTSLVQNGLHWRNKMEQTGLTGMNPIEFVARQKAWSHGYGNMSDKYWNRIKPLLSVENNDVDEGYKVVPSINRDRYTDLSHEGLEGPIRLKSGKVVYYDPKVGQYYDRDSDFYMSHEEHAAHELEEKSNKLGFKLTPTLVNRRQAHALTTGFKKNKFNFEEYEAESLDDELANFRSNKSGPGRAQNPFASAEPAREMPRKPQISPAEIEQRTSQLNRCKQLLDIVNSTKNTDVTLSRIGNYIDKIDVNRFNPGELDNIEKYLSNYVAGAVSKKSRKVSKHGRVTRIDPADVMAEDLPMRGFKVGDVLKYKNSYGNIVDVEISRILPDGRLVIDGPGISYLKVNANDSDIQPMREGIGPDMDDPYEQGWYARWSDANPYQKGTPEHASWAAGQAERESQPNHYDESIEEGKTGPGLWANIHKKQERIKHGSGERMRKPGSKGAPTAANLKAAGKTESVTEGGRLDLSSPEEKAARKAYIKANGHPPPLTPTSVVAKYNPEHDKKIRDYYLRRKGIPQDKLDKMKEDGVSETTGDPRFDKMLKGITGKKAVAKQKKADTKQQSRDAFGSMFGGGNPADALSIRKKGVDEARANTKNARAGLAKREKSSDPIRNAAKEKEDQAMWDMLQKHIAKQKKEPGVAESSEKKTMSRAAKGNEKYGKSGMQALAKAGREGKDLDKVRDKYNKYDESVAEDAKFGGYYKGTQKGAPRPGQSFGSMEESISLNTTVKAIANDIGEPITSMYATLKKMAKQYYDNNGDLKRFGLVAAGVGSRWFQQYYVNKMQTDLYDLTRQSPTHAAELKQFLRGKMIKDNLVMPKSFSDLNKELPEILARMGSKMGADALKNNAKLWVHNKQDYEDFINKLVNGKGGDDDGDGYGAPATVDTPSKDALLGKQRNHAEEIVNDVLRKLSSSVAGDIRNAIARAPNKLQALQQELQRRKIAPPMEEGIAGNMKVRSDPLTNLKQHKDIKMKTPDPFKGMASHNNLASAKARNLVAKGAQTAGPGTGSHKNKALDVKKGLTRNLKHKNKFDFSESANFLTWAVSSGYNVITNPAVYENAKRMYNTMLTEGKDELKPGQYYIWTVHFDDGDSSRIKIKDEKFDVKAYYRKQNKSVVNVDYNWEPHNG